MYAFSSELASTCSVRANHDCGYSNGNRCNNGRYHFHDDLSAVHLMAEEVWDSCNQEETALEAQGKDAEAGQVLQATEPLLKLVKISKCFVTSYKVMYVAMPHALVQTPAHVTQQEGMQS